MTATMEEQVRKIFEGFEYNEGRHARPIEIPVDQDVEQEPQDQEPSFTDNVAKNLAKMQTTIEELQMAIEKEQESIRNGNIGSVAGMEKIKSWQSRLNVMRHKSQMLQTALNTYMGDQSEDNDLNLRIATAKARY